MTLLEPAPGALLECCASRRWAAAVADGSPYDSLEDLLTASDQALAGLTEQDVDEALSAHPRIGERAGGDRRDATWSRQEQSGATVATTAVKDAITEGNVEYERRFGRVFLICATGLTGERMLTALQTRLDNDADTERAVVREELRKIVRLRLVKLVGP